MRIAALVVMIAALAAPRRAIAQDPPSEREYAVWSALVDAALADSGTKRVVVEDETVPGDRRQSSGPFEQRSMTRQRDPTPLPAELLDAFARANRTMTRVDPARFHTRVHVQVVSQAGKQKVPAENDHQAWMEMQDGGYRGSSGVVQLSRVGFTGDGRTALVFASYYCGGLCAGETYYVLALGGDGRWTITRHYMTMVS